MSNERELEEIIDILQQYFDKAKPDDDQYNISLIKKDIERYDGHLLVMGPYVLIAGLQQGAASQTLSFLDEDAADKQLQSVGLSLIMCYLSLVKGFESDGVLGIIKFLQQRSDEVEDVATIMAYAFADLAPSTSPLIAGVTGYAVPILNDAFNKAYGTGFKVSLAYALLQCGIKEPFRSFAIPRLISRDKHIMLERMLDSKDKSEQRFLEWLVLGSIIMDIASEGRAIPEWKAWKRKG